MARLQAHQSLRSLSSASRRPAFRPGAPTARPFHSKPADASEALGTPAKLPEAEPVRPVKRRESITIQDISSRREKAGRLVAGTAAAADSDMFKAPPAADKPLAKRWDHLLSEESRSRKPCMLKQAARHLKRPGIISLGGGIPCPEYFPFESLTMRVPRPPDFSDEALARTGGQGASIGKYDTLALRPDAAEYDLSIALNYGQAHGSAQLMRWVTEHTELVCRPPYADWRSCLTIGSTGALEQALRMFCDRARHDSLLTEEFSFSTAIETAAPLGVRVFGVPMDEQGLLPEAMDEMLRSWDAEARGGASRPRVLYTVPSGQNPTGATQGEQRRRAIYAVCQRHDVYVLEDEPYYFLQMQPYTGRDAPDPPPPASIDEFLSTLIPSYLSMDVDGRVMRMDSFSKVVVPGSRLGWITASAQIVERYIRHAEVASQGPSGFSQAVLWKLLDETWGHEGYLKWLIHLRMEYSKRRNAILAACEDYLPRDVVSWTPPAAGMFHWLRVNHALHPDAANRSILEIEEEIFNKCIEDGVLVARGSWFQAEQEKPPSSLCFRATYAAATPENMREAIRRFGAAIRSSFQIP